MMSIDDPDETEVKALYKRIEELEAQRCPSRLLVNIQLLKDR